MCMLKVVVSLLLMVAVVGCSMVHQNAETAAGRRITDGWLERTFEFEIQKPWDLKLEDRYAFDPATNTHRFVVYGTDKPHQPPPNRTNARTEMRIHDTYTTGAR